MQRTRRTFRAYIVEPFKQLRFGLRIIAVSLFFIVLFAFLFVRASVEQYQQVIEFFQVADATALIDNTVFRNNAIIMGSTLFVFIIVMLYIVFRFTHRMYGPMISIMRFIRELRGGNYAVRLKIRERDEFQNLAIELNLFAEELHKKYGSTNVQGVAPFDALDRRNEGAEAGIVEVSKP